MNIDEAMEIMGRHAYELSNDQSDAWDVICSHVFSSKSVTNEVAHIALDEFYGWEDSCHTEGMKAAIIAAMEAMK